MRTTHQTDTRDNTSHAHGTPRAQVVDRRPGDLAVVYADTAKAASELGWTAKLGLDEMCRDLWAWQSANPNGFAKK